MPTNNRLQKPITDAKLIAQLLPHREPMVLVDALVYFDGKKAIANLTILNSNIFVENHQCSESGLIEHMAQSAALFTGYKHQIQNSPTQEGFIASIKNLKIESLPKVNEVVATEVELTYELALMSMVNIVSKVNDKTIATAEMTLVLKGNE